MAETPEIPEADDAFSRRVAISIAVLAVCISFIGNFGDNAKTDSILKTTKAANQWSYFQAKSVKEHAFGLEKDLLSVMAPGAIDAGKRDDLVTKYEKKIAQYEQEKKDIGFGQKDAKGAWIEVKGDDGKAIISATQLEEEAEHGIRINDRCDFAALLLSLAVIICSVAILMKHHYVWFVGLAIGCAGAVVGSTVFFM